MAIETGPSEKLAVFNSYSRDDIEIADGLEVMRELADFAPALDRHGISGAENWQQRLGAMIRDADTVVFVLSPASARSNICKWEVEEAVRLGKRIVPVAGRPLDGATPPPALGELNYIFFYPEPKRPGSGIKRGTAELIKALRTDLSWMRDHTRYLQRAMEWQAGGRQKNRLLTGSDVSEAKGWAARRPRDAPEPTALHLEFIATSENWLAEQQDEQRRQLAERERLVQEAEADRAGREAAQREATAAAQREAEQARRVARLTKAGLSVALVLAIVAAAAGGLAWRQGQEAERQAKVAQVNLRKAQISESHFRAEQAKQTGEDHITAMLLALEALPDNVGGVERPFVNEAWYALYGAHLKQRERAVLAGHKDGVISAVFSADGKRILTASLDKTARLWDADGKPLATLEGHKDAVRRAAFSGDGAFIITASADHTAHVWRVYPDPQELVNVAKERVPRCLAPKEREDLFLPLEPPAWCKTMSKWPYDAATLAAAHAEARKYSMERSSAFAIAGGPEPDVRT
jgi:TIR domain/WD domain, G-beta repeat